MASERGQREEPPTALTDANIEQHQITSQFLHGRLQKCAANLETDPGNDRRLVEGYATASARWGDITRDIYLAYIS
jgi:hypothetical protein